MTPSWPSLAVHVVGWTLIDTSLVFVLLFPAYLVSLIVCGRHSSTTRYAAGCTMLILVLLGTLGSLARQIIDRPTPTELMAADLGVPLRSTSPRPLRPINEPGVARAPLFPHETPPSWLDRLSEQVEPVLPYALAVWLGGVLILTGQNATGLVRIAKITRRGQPAVSRDVERWSILARKLGVQRTVRYLATKDLLVPATVGWLKPVVLFPVCLTTHFGIDEIDAMIAHELAHVRRWDYLFTILLAVLTTVLFFHPCLWVLSAQLRRDREAGCDAAAGRVCGSPKLVAECLIKMAELVTLSHGPRLALGFGGSSLLHRVRTLRTDRPTPVSWPALATIFSVVLGCALALSGQAIARADALREREMMAKTHESVFVFDLLGEAPAGPSFERVFAAALQAQEQGARPDDARIAALVHEIRKGADDSLVWRRYASRFSPFEFPTAIEEYPQDWQFADTYTQSQLARSLWRYSKSVPNQYWREEIARAALAVVSMKREGTGIAALSAFAFDDQFEELTGLPSATDARLKVYCVISGDAIGRSQDALRRLTSALLQPDTATANLNHDLEETLASGSRHPALNFEAYNLADHAAEAQKNSIRQTFQRAASRDPYMASLLAAGPPKTAHWAVFDAINP